MEMKVRLTVLMAPDAVKELDDEAKARGIGQSEVVEEGIRLLRRKRLGELGDPAMADETTNYGIGYG